MSRWLAHLPRWPTLLLAIAYLVGISACLMQLLRGSEAQSILTTTAERIAEPTPLRDSSRNALDLSGIQNAALFYESRSFYTPPVIPEVQTRPDYRLSGTLTIPKQPVLAMLIHNQSGARLKIHEGDDLEGWSVESIHAQLVTLRHGEQQFEIRSAARASAPGMQPVSLPGSTPAARPPEAGVKILGSPRWQFVLPRAPQVMPQTIQNEAFRPHRPPG